MLSIFLFSILAFIGFGYAHTTIQTVPNWDYYKYTKLITDISRSLARPSILWEQDGKWHTLAYYYSLFLPTAYISNILKWTNKPFLQQLLFIGINITVLGVLFRKFLSHTTNPSTFVFLLLTLIGLDGWLIPLISHDFSWFINDIQDGGPQKFFMPLRIQDFVGWTF